MAGRLFELHRHLEPVMGGLVTAVAVVADGVEFDDDMVVVRWRGEYRSTAMWSDLSHLVADANRDGDITVVWDES